MNKTNLLISAGVLVALSLPGSSRTPVAGSAQAPSYPVAHRDNTVDTYFGTAVPAPYQWMENLNDPALRNWVAEENALTRHYLDKLPIRGWMELRLKEVWDHPTESTPIQVDGGVLFFTRNSGIQNQSAVYVQHPAESKPQIVLDPNQISPSGDIALAGFQPSPNGQYLVYALSKGGSDWETIHVRDVTTGKDLSDELKWVKFTPFSWTHDSAGFFYSRYSQPTQGDVINQKIANQELYYHRIGTPQQDDRLIYKLTNRPEWVVAGYLDDSGRYLFITTADGTSPNNELHFADLGNPAAPDITAAVKPLFTHNDAHYSPFGIVEDTLYLQTTKGATRGRIVAASLADPDPKNWRVVVPEADGVLQDSSWNKAAPMADGKLIANYMLNATSQLKLYSTTGKLLHTFRLPDMSSVGYNGVSARNDGPIVYYASSSFLAPTSVHQFNVRTGRAGLFFKPDVNFDFSKYQTKQVYYTSKDGTKVPMFIVAKKGIKLDGSHPTVLYAYGGFGITVSPSYSPIVPVWLELGGVYAVANIRGGGFYGESWHQAGMFGNKQNVFDDFAWAAKYLEHTGYASRDHLAIQGYSNGGLLTATSIIQRPELFGAAYIGHGVLDMLRYQKFSGGGFWATEFGSSDKRDDFVWLMKYSPLQNIRVGTCYPPTLITTSWQDDRVVPSHEFKFAARIQQAQACANPILLLTTSGTAHNYMPIDKEIAQTADIWSFEGYHLGIRTLPAGLATKQSDTGH